MQRARTHTYNTLRQTHNAPAWLRQSLTPAMMMMVVVVVMLMMLMTAPVTLVSSDIVAVVRIHIVVHIAAVLNACACVCVRDCRMQLLTEVVTLSQ